MLTLYSLRLKATNFKIQCMNKSLDTAFTAKVNTRWETFKFFKNHVSGFLVFLYKNVIKPS